MWALSYLGSNFGLIIVCIVAVVALGAIAWFARNWKVAVAAAVCLAVGFAYMQIDKSAYQRRVAEEAAEQVKILTDRLNVVNSVNRAYTDRYLADDKKIKDLERLARETPKNDAACLPRDAAGRVRAIR